MPGRRLLHVFLHVANNARNAEIGWVVAQIEDVADRILVLENGQIAEQGSHYDLVKLGGKYAELFELQAAGYR